MGNFAVVSLLIGLTFVTVRGLRRSGLPPRLRRPSALAGLGVLALYAVVATADSISWADGRLQPQRTLLDRLFERTPERTYSAPLAGATQEPFPKRLNEQHLLGTDGTGNDVLYRTLKGIRTAFLIGGLTTVIVTPIAVFFGSLAGYFGGFVDDLVQFVYTVLDSIPGILLLIAIMMVLGPGLVQLCVALGVTSWVGLCRLVRGETLKQREREYVVATRALGYGHARILRRHILPNVLPVVLVSGTLGFSRLVLSEAILSYLGLGVPDDVGSWGNMIEAARLELSREPAIWWNLVAASTALFIMVLALNVVGDALRDVLDPRLRGA